MATRSFIGKTRLDGNIDYIYCHWDGYPEKPGVGWHLEQTYNTPEKVDSLIALGDLSALKETLEKSEAYYRDMGRDFRIGVAPSREEFYEGAAEVFAEWAYLWDGEQWITRRI